MNRADQAWVTASSFRLARLSEIPRAREFKSVHLDESANWPRQVPLYINDGSTVTQWATDEDAAYVQYDFKSEVSIAEVQVYWGADAARSFELLLSSDLVSWKRMGEGSGQPNRLQVFSGGPLTGRYLRLSCLSSLTGKGISVRELSVFGAAGEEPAPAGQVRLDPQGENGVRLTWAPASPPTYRYCVYRTTSPAFRPAPDNRAGCSNRTEFSEEGLRAGTYYYTVQAEAFSGRASEPSSPAAVTIGDSFRPSPFPFRGIVEGFYNDPWPHTQRLKIIGFMLAAGLNYYIYAPKNDPYQRQLWRQPYPASEMQNFRELIAAARAHGVTFNYGISPGLDFRYQQPAEVQKLLAKLKTMADLGVRSFTICLDDIPGWKTADGKTAADHVRLLNHLYAEVQKLAPEAQLFFVPTVYIDTYENLQATKPHYAEYLRVLSEMNPKIHIMWTGPGQIFSETISLAAAQSLARVLKRKVMIWDNVPVNDCSLRYHIIMAPYTGRDRRLSEAVSGIFLNPMYLPNASMVTLYTAGKYLADPQNYDPEAAYQDALRFLDQTGNLAVIADALKFHPLFPHLAGVDRLPLTKKMDAFWAARAKGRAEQPEKELRELFRAYTEFPKALRYQQNFELLLELWSPGEKLKFYGQAGLAALDYLKATDPQKRKELEGEIGDLLNQARLIPWKVADNRLDGLYQPPGSTAGIHINVMESFIKYALKSR